MLLAQYPADEYMFLTRTQERDGPLPPPSREKGWLLVGVCAAEDKDAAIVVVVWARKRPSRRQRA